MMILDVEASAKSISGKTYQDHVQQKIVVDPVGIKLYIVASNFYKLDGGSKSYIENANYSQYLTHIDVILTGDYLSGLINLDKEFALYPSDYIEDDVAKFKRNVDTFQYLSIKGKNPSKSILYQQYQTVLAKLIQGYSNANSSSFRANFGDIIATAMTIGAIPKDNQTVYLNFDIVQKLQDSSGTFSPQDFDFSFRQPDRNLDSLTILNLKYYAAAYCLIPFIKHKQFMDNRYNDFIKKGFQYLGKVENRLGVFNIGLSMAAYVYALDNQKDKAKFLLEQVEKDFVELEDNKKCYKVTSDDKNCDIEHTVYVALTYLALNDLLNAQPIVYYLLSKKQPYDLTQNVKYLSIITEPIAKMGIMLNIENTNLKVTIKNEKDFQTILSISNKNSNVSQTIQMPPGSTEVNSVISGNGYCTISAVFERIITVPVVNDPFDLSYYIDDNISTDDEKYVAVVLRYSPGSEDKPVIRSVVFEVEMPSGYIYSKYKANDYPQKVQEVRTRRQGTVVDLFFENLEADEYITMEFGARKKYKVRDAANAGIKVYDYDHKDRVAVQFYKFKDYDDNEC